MVKELFKKYLQNSCTDEEFDEFTGWVKKESFNKESINWGFDDWKSFEPELKKGNEKKYNALLDKIHHKINLKQRVNADSRVISLSRITSWTSRAAAILFLPLLGVVFYMLLNNNIRSVEYADSLIDSLEIIAPVGSRTVVQLSDGTEINLNYGSKIKYPREFVGDSREITLEGEGYFDVAHNPDKPFIVKTDKLNIKALGTEFNVEAYQNSSIVATTLVEGKVVIEKAVHGEKNESLGEMVPGQHVAYDLFSEKIYHSSQGNIEKYIAWKDGKLIFDNEPITSLAEKLSRMFNVDIDVAENAKEYTYTVTFIDEPLFHILDLMSRTTPVTYNVFPRKKMTDGTYSKQKIQIEKRQ